MASPGCWGPLCEFTGSRTQSDAHPGRCTNTSGYIAYAEINEIIKRHDDIRIFHDHKSNTDVMLYNGQHISRLFPKISCVLAKICFAVGDYVSYMTPVTKDTRRSDWKGLHFAGTIDWAVDLQEYTSDDFNALPERSAHGHGCTVGGDLSASTGSLCDFSCKYGFCPETLCECYAHGPPNPLPPPTGMDIKAFDPLDPDLNRLCKFACGYGWCESDICDLDGDTDVDDLGLADPKSLDREQIKLENSMGCWVYKDTRHSYLSTQQCLSQVCSKVVEDAKKEGRITNYGCVAHTPLGKAIPWERLPGGEMAVRGRCHCDNELVNVIADTVMESLATIAQVWPP
jgi:hypothetical protein